MGTSAPARCRRGRRIAKTRAAAASRKSSAVAATGKFLAVALLALAAASVIAAGELSHPSMRDVAFWLGPDLRKG